MILMFPVTQGTLHLIGKLSMVFLLLQAGCFSWDISKKWPPKALSVPRTTSNWFLFLLCKQCAYYHESKFHVSCPFGAS